MSIRPITEHITMMTTTATMIITIISGCRTVLEDVLPVLVEGSLVVVVEGLLVLLVEDSVVTLIVKST